MTTALPTLLNSLSGQQAFVPPSGSSTASAGPGGINHGICSLTWQDRTFRFRTNPNEIWWSYELLTKTMETYGGRVIQLLGTKLGDLKVMVDCGSARWPYLVQVVSFLRDLLSDQRNGNPATFEYTTRNWKLNVYSMSIPFEDQMDATVREIELNFKIQEDISGALSKVTLDADILRLSDGVYGPGQATHNRYNDTAQMNTPSTVAENPNIPSYVSTGIVNLVDTQPQGNDPLGANPLSALGGMVPLPSIPGVGNIGSFLGM